MAECENGLKGIFELVSIAGGLENEITRATFIHTSELSASALLLRSSDIFFHFFKNGKSTTKVIPWSRDENRKPTALAFSPSAEWLLVAMEDGSICIIPLEAKRREDDASQFRGHDIVFHQPNGSRARPTAVVWWNTISGEGSLAIVGTELGELCFVELNTGKDVGGTYITVPVTELYICRDNSLDTIYLLISGTEDRQWRLILEKRSCHYLYPLENITPEWGYDDPLMMRPSLDPSPLPVPEPRSRLSGLKRLSVEKLHLLKQRLSEGKQSYKKRPLTESRGVDTCDIDDAQASYTNLITPQKFSDSTKNVINPDPTAASPITQFGYPSNQTRLRIEEEPSVDSDLTVSISTRPERMSDLIYDITSVPQYAKGHYLLAGRYKPNNCLMVYRTDLENTPLYVYKLPEGVKKFVLHDELIFVTYSTNPSKLSIISTYLSESSKISGEIESRVSPLLQDVYLPDGEEILHIFPSPPFLAEALKADEAKEADFETNTPLPSSTYPNGCLIVTQSSLYLCQSRKSIEKFFMELILNSGDIEAANRLALIFALDTKLFELAADQKLQSRSFSASVALYKHSRCPPIKCSLKFAWAGLAPEFLAYMNSLMSFGSTDLSVEQRRHFANLAVLANLQQLSLPAGFRSLQQQQTQLRNLLLLLRNNIYYDELLTLVVAAATWRWETLQYLASTRGLLLEKLHVLLCEKVSILKKVPGATEDQRRMKVDKCHIPIFRERETGYLHCITDPELRAFFLFQPSLARAHMAFVRSHLEIFDVSLLRRLAALYDPTQLAIRPFIYSFKHSQKYNMYLWNLKSLASQDPIGLDTLTQAFLSILIKLNEKRGWTYNPELLSIPPVEPSKKPPFYDSCIRRRYLACGYGHSVVVLNGVGYSWGLADYGILGNGPRASLSLKFLDKFETSLADEIKELVNLTIPSEYNYCGTQTDPQTYPPETELDCSEPIPISYFKNVRVFSVACGKHHALAISSNGVYGWGSNLCGQIGVGSTGRHPHPILIQSLSDKDVVQVSCGQFHSMAVTRGGRLFTWGWGVHGQLGLKKVEDSHKPMLVTVLGRKKIVEAFGGYAHTVALTSKGTVYAWGCSTYGQVGTGGIQKVTSPIRVLIPETVTHLAAGYFHNIATTKDYKVYVWGSNPSCLRVQAQIQRKNRTLQQREEENSKKEEQTDVETNDSNITSMNTKDLDENRNTNVRGQKGHFSISANTVPSCDPQSLSHLLPKEVEMPPEYGIPKSVSAGNQHSLLLTTQGALYSWGKNMSGQLGTGSRKESQSPMRILEDVCITEVAAGSDFNLAFDCNGQVWGWGSNYYSQLGHSGSSGEDRGNQSRVFMLKTSKRVLKVPRSIHSNVETPRKVANLPLPLNNPATTLHYSDNEIDAVDLNNEGSFSGVVLSSLDSSLEEIEEKDLMERKDDGLYGTITLHSSLSLLHPHYNPKNVAQMLVESKGHQALATLYKLERQHSKAMHHQLCALLTHKWVGQNPETEEGENLTYSGRHIEEAVRILDHFLRLQTEESQSGMRGVLEEGIGLWLSHSLPISHLEDILLTHLPRTVYPLALLLFGDESAAENKKSDIGTESGTDECGVEEATTKVLSQLSTKFCLNLCSSVITHLQAGESGEEQLDALSQMVKLNTPAGGDKSQALVGSGERNPQKEVPTSDEEVAAGGRAKKKNVEKDSKEYVRFTCGHHFTVKDFQAKVLPQLERTVTMVPGLLGKTARVLLDQYHTDQPEMACPHCVLAHLTIKLTKHNQPSP